MRWEAVNAMVFESATHRVRRVGGYWLAERKSLDGERSLRIGGSYRAQADAQAACERDAYSLESGR